MTDCRDTLEDLYPFLDGELSSELQAHVREHLEGCTDCFEAFDFEAELKMAIRRKCSNDELPPSLIERLEACLKAGFEGGAASNEGN